MSKNSAEVHEAPASIKAKWVGDIVQVQIIGDLPDVLTILEKVTQSIYKALPEEKQGRYIEFLESTKNELKGDN